MSNTALQQVANRLAINEDELQNIIMSSVMPNQKATIEQFISFVAVANEYKLNPLTKEIYAYPTGNGGIQPIVSIDGWLRIINTHPEFNGMVFSDNRSENGEIISITCGIHKKGIQYPVEVTEYMDECKKNTEPWRKWPARMLRHKAAIQAGRYAFGLSGIIDPDEAERFKEVGVIQEAEIVEYYPEEKFKTNFPIWEKAVQDGKATIETLLKTVGSVTPLTEEQKDKVKNIKGNDIDHTRTEAG